MKKFGYSLQADRTIDYDKNDKRFMEYLMLHESSVKTCIGCGCCTATCSAGHFTDFNIRRVHTFLRRGEMHDLKKEMQKCMFCGKCQLVCPRGIHLRNLILIMNQAIERIG